MGHASLSYVIPFLYVGTMEVYVRNSDYRLEMIDVAFSYTVTDWFEEGDFIQER